ncbi:MAG: flagellar basal body rod C-terminal domain-containing protein, partial [Methylococcales bacterium]
LPPAEKIDIGNDGTISIIPIGGAANELAIIDRIKMVKPDVGNLEKLSDGLMHTKDGSVAQADASISLVQGALESSNVNAVSALVEMIELSKNFELQTKVMKTANDNSGVSAKLMQMA